MGKSNTGGASTEDAGETALEQSTPVDVLVAPDINHLMEVAMQQGEAGVAALERLVDLQERMHNRHAETKFTAALSTFQNECPTLARNKTATIKHRGGGEHEIKYTELDYMVRTITPILHRVGISFAWENHPDCPVTHVQKVVILSHTAGHTRRFLGPAFPVDTGGLVSPAQAVGIADSFAKRYTLSASLGFVTGGDTDGANPDPPINENQCANILALMEEVGGNNARFLQHFGIDQIAHLPASRYEQAVQMLNTKRAAGHKPPEKKEDKS